MVIVFCFFTFLFSILSSFLSLSPFFLPTIGTLAMQYLHGILKKHLASAAANAVNAENIIYLDDFASHSVSRPKNGVAAVRGPSDLSFSPLLVSSLSSPSIYRQRKN